MKPSQLGAWRCAVAIAVSLLGACGGGRDEHVETRHADVARASVAMVSGTDAAPAPAVNWFTDATAEAGLPTDLKPGYGSAWGDVNGDGWPDVWIVNHMYKPSLYVNQKNGTFVNAIDSLWTGDPETDSHGAAWGDFDNDGDQDLIVLGGANRGTGSEPKPFYVNQAGHLADAADLHGLNDIYARGRTPLWLDWNNDGRLDLFSANTNRPADLLSPSRLMLQGVDQFFTEVPAMATQSDSTTAQLLYMNSKMHLLVSNVSEAFPTGLYVVGNTQAVPMRFAVSPGNPRVTGKVQDTVIGDFNDDQAEEILVLQADPRDPAVTITDHDKTIESLVKDIATQERGFTFRAEASGIIHLTLFFTRWRADQIHLGLSAVASNALRTGGDFHGEFEYWTELDLDPNDPAVQGVPPKTLRTGKGLYIGKDADNLWHVYARGSSADALHARLTVTDDRFTAVSPIGFGAGKADISKAPVFLFYRPSDGMFVNRATLWGLPATLSCTSGVAGDFDNDMDLDLYLACSSALANLDNRLFENVGGRFLEVPNAGGAATPNVSTGGRVSMADYDQDGRLDLLVTDGCENCGTPLGYGRRTLLKNLRSENHWVEFDLVGCASNRDAVGARVNVFAGGRRQTRIVDGGMHQSIQDQRRLHFGLAQNTVIDNIAVTWPSGATTRHLGLAVDRIHTLRERQNCARP